jgi:hypothetical protein
MRWNKSPLPKLGDKKIVRRFLFHPLELDREVRWLETASVEYEAKELPYHFRYMPLLIYYVDWVAVRFVDETGKIESPFPWPNPPTPPELNSNPATSIGGEK